MLNPNSKIITSASKAVPAPVRLALIALLLIGMWSCSHDARPAPKDTIMLMFDAMRESDSVSLAMNIDLAAAARSLELDLAPSVTGSGEVPVDSAALLLSSLVGDGRLRKRWLTDNQIVIGKTETKGDIALVEVSFIDKITRVQYYNKMRLVFRNNRWIVTDFHTL
jgi:hypothetical protein